MILGRRQLPAHSPLSLRAVLAALGWRDPRSDLAEQLRRSHGARDAVLTSSGTGALTLALRVAAERNPGRPVLLPAYACYDLVSAALGAGVSVAFYDVDPDTLGPDAESLALAAQRGAAAIVAVHLFGVPIALDGLRDTARQTDALLIEDAAQGTGASLDGRPLGSAGDLGVLSFGRGKGETGGSGGALLIHEASIHTDELHTRLASGSGSRLASAVKLAGQWTLGRPSLYALPNAIPALRLGETIFHPPTALRAMSPGAARVLAHTRRMVHAEAEVRRRHADHWRTLLGDYPLRIRTDERATPGWLRFPLRMRPAAAATIAEGAPLGIQRGYPIPLHRLDVAARLLTGVPPVTRGAEELARSLVTLPTHSLLRDRDVRAIERWLARALPRNPHS